MQPLEAFIAKTFGLFSNDWFFPYQICLFLLGKVWDFHQTVSSSFKDWVFLLGKDCGFHQRLFLFSYKDLVFLLGKHCDFRQRLFFSPSQRLGFSSGKRLGLCWCVDFGGVGAAAPSVSRVLVAVHQLRPATCLTGPKNLWSTRTTDMTRTVHSQLWFLLKDWQFLIRW